MTQQRSYARPRSKIETLVDLIFGLSLSIGAIALITGSSPSSTTEINSHIIAFIFAASFLVTSWMVYTYQMSVLPIETSLLTFLNVVMLMLIAIIPYLLYNVEFGNPALSLTDSSAIRNYASSLFSLDLAGILAILSTFSHVISIEEKHLVAPEMAKRFGTSRNVQAILSIITLVSLAPQLWESTLFDVPLREYIWFIPIIVYWVRRSAQSQ